MRKIPFVVAFVVTPCLALANSNGGTYCRNQDGPSSRNGNSVGNRVGNNGRNNGRSGGNGGSGNGVLNCNDGGKGQLLCIAIDDLAEAAYKCTTDACYWQVQSLSSHVDRLKEWADEINVRGLTVGDDVAQKAVDASKRVCSSEYHGYTVGFSQFIVRTIVKSSQALESIQNASENCYRSTYNCQDYGLAD